MYDMWVDSIAGGVYKPDTRLFSRQLAYGWEKTQKVKNCLRKVGEVFYQTKKVFLSGKKDLKPMQKTERKTKKPQTDKALPSGVSISIVNECFLWLGFKKPSTYWG